MLFRSLFTRAFPRHHAYNLGAPTAIHHPPIRRLFSPESAGSGGGPVLTPESLEKSLIGDFSPRDAFEARLSRLQGAADTVRCTLWRVKQETEHQTTTLSGALTRCSCVANRTRCCSVRHARSLTSDTPPGRRAGFFLPSVRQREHAERVSSSQTVRWWGFCQKSDLACQSQRYHSHRSQSGVKPALCLFLQASGRVAVGAAGSCKTGVKVACGHDEGGHFSWSHQERFPALC